MVQLVKEDFKRPKVRRPQDDKGAEAFLEVASYIEDSNEEQMTINNFIELMNQKTDMYWLWCIWLHLFEDKA